MRSRRSSPAIAAPKLDPDMSNTAWQNGRRAAGEEDPFLADLRVHELRHTVRKRLLEANVRESTVADILWHDHRSITGHYSVAQIDELERPADQESGARFRRRAERATRVAPGPAV
jgi:integrase